MQNCLMKTAKSLLLASCAAAVLVGAPTSSASAQEIQITGPLAGAPAVRRMRMHREGRFQLIVPTVGYTLQDEFSRSLMVGLEANIHFTDYLGVGVWGAAANFANAFQINTDLTAQVIENGQTTGRNALSMPTNEGFGDQVARLLGIASAHVIFAPLRGKLALFQGAFVDTDFYIMAGFAMVFVEERARTDAMIQTACSASPTDTAYAPCRSSQGARQVNPAGAPSLGVGLNLYFNEFIGLAIQWRAFPIDMNPMGTDESGLNATSEVGAGFPDGAIDGRDRRFYFHHMANIGLIINLPPDANVTD